MRISLIASKALALQASKIVKRRIENMPKKERAQIVRMVSQGSESPRTFEGYIEQERRRLVAIESVIAWHEVK